MKLVLSQVVFLGILAIVVSAIPSGYRGHDTKTNVGLGSGHFDKLVLSRRLVGRTLSRPLRPGLGTLASTPFIPGSAPLGPRHLPRPRSRLSTPGPIYFHSIASRSSNSNDQALKKISTGTSSGINGFADNLGAGIANFGNGQGAGLDALLSSSFNAVGNILSGIHGSGAVNTAFQSYSGSSSPKTKHKSRREIGEPAKRSTKFPPTRNWRRVVSGHDKSGSQHSGPKGTKYPMRVAF